MRFVLPDLFHPMDHPKAVRRAVAQRREAVIQAWRAHNDALRPTLPPDLVWLLDFSLDDAVTRSLRIVPAEKRLTLTLWVGDAQRGYFEAELDYTGIILTRMETQLLCLIVADERNDIYWSELEREDDGSYVHRIRWHTRIAIGDYHDKQGNYLGYHTLGPELAFRFTAFHLTLTPPPKKWKRPKNPIAIKQDQSEQEAWGDFMLSLR